MHPAMI